MAQCVINGIPVLFPYVPYKVQEDYMSKVIECLKKVKLHKCIFLMFESIIKGFTILVEIKNLI